MTVSHFENPSNATYARWEHNGLIVEKQYSRVVFAVELQSHDGVAMVEPYQGHPNNGVIYNGDGTLRIRLVNPPASKGSICFAYPYYVKSELTFVAAFPESQFGCVFDESGNCLRTYEMR